MPFEQAAFRRRRTLLVKRRERVAAELASNSLEFLFVVALRAKRLARRSTERVTNVRGLLRRINRR